MEKRLIIFLYVMIFVVNSVLSQSQWENAISNYSYLSLPLVNIETNTESLTRDKYISGRISIYDGEMRTEGKLLSSFNCKLRYRGATSLQYDKKSFAIKLIDSNGDDLDANILGIRTENDWILDAMAINRIRMRYRVCFDIWNDISCTPYNTDFDNRNGTLGYFVEVYLNGEYHGLYCLSDKIDRKLLGLKKAKVNDGNVYVRGLLYKGEKWTDATQFIGYDSSQTFDSETWNGWELQYPDDNPSYEVWQPLMSLIDFTNESNAFFQNNYKEHYYFDNLVDYMLFLMAFNIIDNNMKNTFLSCPDINENQRFLITPWDLDCSLGGLYNGTHYDYYTKLSSFTGNHIFNKMYIYDINSFRSEMNKKWQIYLKSILSPQSFSERLDAYANRFVESGAWQRERDKWNNNPVPLDLDEELEYVKNWYINNVSVLNTILGVSTDLPSVYSETPDDNKYYYLDGKVMMNTLRKNVLHIVNGNKYY